MISRAPIWFLAYSLICLLTLMPLQKASAQIQDQPTQIIEASPISNFSERAALWPSSDIQEPNTENKRLSDVFNETPGIQARESGSPTLSIRGSSGADRVLKLFEGIPLNLGDGLGGSNLFIPEEAIGSIRVFKGPASAFYGSSAISGAIDHRERLFTKPAARIALTDLREKNVFAVTPFLSEIGSGQVTGSYSQNPGDFPFRSTTTNISGNRQHNGSNTSRITALANFNAGSISIRPIFLTVRSAGETPSPLNSNFPSDFDYSAFLSGVEVSKSLSETRKISVRLADVRQWGLFDRSTASESTSFVSRTLLTGDYQADIASSTVSRTFFDLKWDQLNSSYLDGSLRQANFEAGEGLLIALSPTLSLQPVVRYRSNSGDFIKAMGFVRADNFGKQWLTYSEGFREASLSDRFSSTSYFKGNPGLQPERTQSVESGFFYGENDGANLGATLFSTRYTNLFDSTASGTVATTKINSGSALTSGTEITGGYRFRQERLNIMYSYLDSKAEDTQAPLRLAPRNQIATSFEHRTRYVISEFKNTFWSTYYDREVPSNNLRELPSWSTWDLNVHSDHLVDWELKAGILNIFDISRELTISYPEPQRRLYVSALRSW
jgi:vitamin B12 transporter